MPQFLERKMAACTALACLVFPMHSIPGACCTSLGPVGRVACHWVLSSLLHELLLAPVAHALRPWLLRAKCAELSVAASAVSPPR